MIASDISNACCESFTRKLNFLLWMNFVIIMQYLADINISNLFQIYLVTVLDLREIGWLLVMIQKQIFCRLPIVYILQMVLVCLKINVVIVIV